MARPPDDTYWKTILLAVGERTIPPSERLIGDLLSSPGISSTIAGVNDHITEVLIIFVAAGKNYGFRTFVLASGNASLELFVYSCLRQLGT